MSAMDITHQLRFAQLVGNGSSMGAIIMRTTYTRPQFHSLSRVQLADNPSEDADTVVNRDSLVHLAFSTGAEVYHYQIHASAVPLHDLRPRIARFCVRTQVCGQIGVVVHNDGNRGHGV